LNGYISEMVSWFQNQLNTLEHDSIILPNR
jgi:hypothetical protein